MLVIATNYVQASTHDSVSQTRLSGVPSIVTNTPTSTPLPVYCGQFINFAAPVNYPLGTRPQSVTVGDFNNDGFPDLIFVLPGRYSNNVAVLLGNGNGTFRPAINSPTGLYPEMAEAKDFDGDGNLDIAVPRSTDGTLRVLPGYGNGTFGTGIDYYVGGLPHEAVAADFNGDGQEDLAVTISNSSYLAVLLGNGDGTFQPDVNHAASSNTYLLAVGDLNGDGHPDLVVPDYGSNSVTILLGNGNGTFQPAINSPTGLYPSSVVVRDLNGDDHQDVALTIADPNAISVLLGNGDGTLQAGINYSVGNGARSLEAADFNGDDKQDLVAATSSGVLVLLGNGDGTFQPASNFPVANNPQSLAVGDLDGDGSQDLAVIRLSNTVSVLLNTCSLPTATPTSTTTYTPTVTGTPPTLTYTPTYTRTRTPTPTPTGIYCTASVESATTNCIVPSTYNDTFTFHTYCLRGNYTYGYYTVYFQVAPTSGGAWTTIDHQDFGQPWYVTFPEGISYQSHTFTENDIPPQYTWYRMMLDGYAISSGDWSEIYGVTPATLLCAPTSTSTPTLTETVTPPINTPTTTGTPTGTRTPTVLAVLVGHVTWQGISQPSTHNTGITGTLSICATGGAPQDYTVSTDARGSFTVATGLPDRTYPWWFKGPRWLATSGSLTISGRRSNPELGIQRAGDTDNSNNVTSQDFVILRNTFGKHQGDPGYDPRGDFTNDRVCNSTDFNLLKGSFGQSGAGPNCP